MKVISTNISSARTVRWKNKDVTTGIFKNPVSSPVYLGTEDVKNDRVVDRKVHGGVDKACYVYSVDNYAYWKNKYPGLDWQYGMFGENLTLEGMNEKEIHVGDVMRVGEARVQVSQPRQPCFKLGIKFNDQGIIRAFIKYGRPGFYLRVLEPGHVRAGDMLDIIHRESQAISIADLFYLLYQQEKNQELLKLALSDNNLPESTRRDLGSLGD